jgi:hypothetical protein
MDRGRLREFVSARCDVGESLFVPRREFREAFKAWRGEGPTPKGLPVAMEALGYKPSTRPYGPDRKTTGVYLHLTLSTGRGVEQSTLAWISEETVETEGGSDDAPRGASELVLGGDFHGHRIRRTDDTPPKVSIFDMIVAVSGAVNPYQTWANLVERFSKEKLRVSYHKFAGQGQTETPVTDARGAVKIINVLPGPRAAKFRDVCADIVVRFLEGNESLVEEIRKNAITNPFDTTLNFSALPRLSNKRNDLVYIIRSPILNAVKIGMWKGSIKKLKERYSTYYGPRLDFKVIASGDCRRLETMAHSALREFRIESELFRKGATDYEARIRELQLQSC